jgi:hypothetical protein
MYRISSVVDTSMTAAALDHHLLVLFQDDVGVIKEVEHRDRCQFRRCATRLGVLERVHQVDQSLDDSVIGGVHVGVEREAALACTVIGGVAFGRYDPVLRATKKLK